MLDKQRQFLVIGLAILGICFFLLSFFPLSYNNLDINFDFFLSRQQIIQKTNDFLKKIDIPPDDYFIIKAKTSFDYKAIAFLVKKVQREKIASIIEDSPLYYWSVVYQVKSFFRQPDNLPSLIRLRVEPRRGRIIGFEAFYEKNIRKQKSCKSDISYFEIKHISNVFLNYAEFDISKFVLTRIAQIDASTFLVWEKDLFDFLDIHISYKVIMKIKDSRVSKLDYFLEVPFSTDKKEEIFNVSIYNFNNALFIILSLFVFVFCIKIKTVEWKRSAPFVILLIITSFGSLFLKRTESSIFLAIELGLYFLGLFLEMAWIIMVFTCAYHLGKNFGVEPYPIRIGYSITLSYIFTFVGISLMLFWSSFLNIFFKSFPGVSLIFSLLPSIKWYAIFAPLAALSAAVLEEVFFRFFLFSFLKKYLKNIFLIIVISSLIWSVVHLTLLEYSELYPFYLKSLIIFPVGVLFGIIFAKFGLASVITTHYLYDNFIIGMFLFKFNQFREIHINLWILIISFLFPLVIAFLKKEKKFVI